MSFHIPLNKLGAGIKESIDNATRYLNDALFLHQNERYQSSILLSHLSFEEAGKALLLMDYQKEEKEITKRQWRKRFCSHSLKNLISIKKIWQDAGYVSPIPEADVWQARFDVDWKNVFTYVDYDFENHRWTSPKEIVRDAENFSHSSMTRASEALKCIIRRVKEFEDNTPTQNF